MLFTPITLGDIKLNNRIVMSPLTRCRASEGRVPNALMKDYYVQRASAGLIISEATAVTPMGVGYPDTPGIWNTEQTDAWRDITEAVHEAGGKIVTQLWHVGRISDPVYLDGKLPVAPSAVAATGHVSLVRPEKPYVTPRALLIEEIPELINDYRKAAENAKKAGFDGVEIHGANGYLLDQFLQSSTNLRSDRYGGSIENRCRLMLEVVDAAISVWGPGRVGVHLSPRCDAHSMGDENPAETFGYLARQLGQRKIAFIFTREHRNQPALSPTLKDAFGGPLIANEAIEPENAETLITSGEADAVAFGKLFIANPDLVERLKTRAIMNEWDADTFYGNSAKGYTDYPTL